MANENQKRRRMKKPRQEWNPHWLLKVLYTLGYLAVSAVKIAIGAAATVLLILIVCGVVFVGTLGDYLQQDILTEAVDWSMEDYDMEETSFIYHVDEGGNIQLLQQIFTTTDRQWASLDEIPQALVDAAVAIEDKRFYEHQGVDWITTIKACVNLFFGSGDAGGSTITQQLIKNVTEENSVTVQRKVMEIFRAYMFEQEYEKDLIMEYYLNEIYLGRGCWGVKSAAAEYFGKELQNLTVAECASLISITNNPSLFNPYSESVYKYKGEERDGAGRNRYRQLNVLDQMLEQGYLTQEEYDEAVAQEMVFKEGIADEDRWTVCENTACGYEGIRSSFTQEGGSYYCPECGTVTSVQSSASQSIYSWFVDAVIIDVASALAEQDGRVWDQLGKETQDYYLERIQKGGYHIYTTLDMEVQEAVDAIYNDLSQVPKTNSKQQLQSAIVVIDNDTGDVVALSGGVGEKDTFFAYNRATQAKLQTGSAQKPISVYAPAFELGVVSPATVLKDMPVIYDGSDGWPNNDSKRYNYARTVYQGIVSSINTIAVRTLDLGGWEYAYSFAKYNFGQNNLTESYGLGNGQSKSDIGRAPLALGALTVGSTVREMSAAYATFANNGIYREARTFTKVYNSSGELVIDNTQDSRKILSDKTVNYMNYCLFNAANYGTGGAAIFNGQNIAGKTGTTSSQRDRWFCGYTSHYTAAVWCGYDQPEKVVLNTNPAAQLWKKVMQPIHKGLPNNGLYNGNAMSGVSVCLDSGLLATDACYGDARGLERVSSPLVYPEDRPDGYCNKHISMAYCVTGGGVATEYCASFPDADIQVRSLVKLTQAEVQDLKKAAATGLYEIYTGDGYVYYTDNNGEDLAWYGFYGNQENPNGVPYLECQLHTQETWEDMDGEGFFGDDEFNEGWGGIVDLPGNNDPADPEDFGGSGWN